MFSFSANQPCLLRASQNRDVALHTGCLGITHPYSANFSECCSKYSKWTSSLDIGFCVQFLLDTFRLGMCARCVKTNPPCPHPSATWSLMKGLILVNHNSPGCVQTPPCGAFIHKLILSLNKHVLTLWQSQCKTLGSKEGKTESPSKVSYR